MKVLATFDGSDFSESIMQQLTTIAGLAPSEFTFLAVAHEPHGRLSHLSGVHPEGTGEVMGSQPVTVGVPDPQWAENRGQAIERKRASLEDYLSTLAAKLPNGSKVEVQSVIADHPEKAIIEAARERGVDVIVMATHSRGPLARALFGSVTEQVVRSGVAPVLVVHPREQ
jgi:nucleotide-binding universal stress UspA family protein